MLTITPNTRLAQFLLAKNEEQQDEMSWQTPEFMPFGQWLVKLFEDISPLLDTNYSLVSNSQAYQIWEQCIIESSHAELLHIPQAIQNSMTAWKLIHQWDVPLDDELFEISPECKPFLDWANSFKNKCHKNNWICQDTLPSFIIAVIESMVSNRDSKSTDLSSNTPHSERSNCTGSQFTFDNDKKFVTHCKFNQSELINIFNLSGGITWAGFTELTSAQKALIKTLKQIGCESVLSELSQATIEQYQLSYDNQREEILGMARWAKAQYIKDPEQNIACVIPELNTLKQQVSKTFYEVFSDDLITTDILPYDISMGEKLSNHPMCHIALLIIELVIVGLKPSELSSLLHSCYIQGCDEEMHERSNLAKEIKTNHTNTISLKYLYNIAQEKCPIFSNIIKQTINQNNSSKWSMVFKDILHTFGWPGDAPLNSPEFQTAERFESLITELQQFDNIYPKTSDRKALKLLKHLAAQTVFQPKAKARNVQIMGVLEAPGISYDQLWLAGMDDSNWPPIAKPNPFIPYELQKKHTVSHATPEKEYAFSKTLIEQIKSSCKVFYTSYVKQTNGIEKSGSAFIKNIPIVASGSIAQADFVPLNQRMHGKYQAEQIIDQNAPPLQNPNNAAGGAYLFKLQAICPFRAFAELRLGAGPLEIAELGVSFIDRGNLVHKCLELFWVQVKNSDRLDDITGSRLMTFKSDSNERDSGSDDLGRDDSSDELQAILAPIINKAIKAEKLEKHPLIDIEKKRVLELLIDWVELESTRPDFKVVATEQSQTINISGMEFKLRVDRIDELPDGSKLIIDYKTGQPNINDWFDDRLEETQLPLYAINQKNLAGIAFAQVNRKQMKFIGITDDKHQFDKMSVLDEDINWQEQLSNWKGSLNNLALEFKQGNAIVDPKAPIKHCATCHLQSLCRIHEEYD